MLTFDIEALGQDPLLGGWDEKDGTAAEFKSNDSNYRVYRPTYTSPSDGSLHIVVKLDHIRGGAQDDHIVLELVFDHLGRAVDGSVSLALGDKLVLPTKALTELGLELGGPKVAAIVAASVEVFNLLSDKLTHDSGGRQVFPVIAQMVADLIGSYVGAGDDQLNGRASADWIEGGRGNDRLKGGGGDDTLTGGWVNDEFDAATLDRYGLSGGDGNDTLFGEGGNDRLIAGTGTDTLDGGEGIDTLDLSSLSLTGHTVNTSLQPGGRLVTYKGGSASLSGIENVVGSADVDSIKGSSDVNRLEGRSGNDLLYGYGDNDTLLGGEGADHLDGGDGNDMLQGGFGDDTLVGGVGNDSLDGGSGLDTAVFFGARSQYTLTKNSDGSITVTDRRTNPVDGVDTLRSIELVKFADGSINPETGLDDAPTLSVGKQSVIMAEAGVSTDGTAFAGVSTATIALTKSDLDAGDTVSFDTTGWTAVSGQVGQVSKLGKYGSVVLDTATGVLTYTLDNADPDTNAVANGVSEYDRFSVTVRDAAGLSVTNAVNFVFNGSADSAAPVFVSTRTPDGAITRVSTAADGTQANGPSDNPVVSADGTKVAFRSTASNLVAGDTNGTTDIFVKDLATGLVTRVSTDANGTQGNGESSEPVFSADGTKLAFTSAASNLVAGDTNGASDVFVKDLVTGVISRISTASDGAQASDSRGYGLFSGSPVFSPDGTKVAFSSSSDSLVADAVRSWSDIFVKDLVTGATTLVTIVKGIGGYSYGPVFSADGTKIAFSSSMMSLVAGDTNGTYDVFVRDLVTGGITRISTAADGAQGNDRSDSVVFSADGTKVAFSSSASNLVAGDTNGKSDIFVKDLATGAISLVSTSANGAQGNDFSYDPVFSADGTKVAFTSYASNLVAGDSNNRRDIFVKDLVTGAINLVSRAADGIQGGYYSDENVFFPDGAKLAFSSGASNLVAGDTNGYSDIFVKALPATLTATPKGAVTDDASKVSVSTKGSLFFTDYDKTDTHTVSATPAAGAIGTLTPVLTKDTTGGATGIIDWTYSVAHSAVASLKAGARKLDTFTVAITDDIGRVSKQTVTVTVTGVNDAPRSMGLKGTTVTENAPPNTTVGMLSAIDPEKSKLTYKLLDSAGGLFKLAGTKLMTAKTLDYEKIQSDTVKVEVSDGALKVLKTFTITVKDVMETIGGTSKANTLKGGIGADKLLGAAGNDTLTGGKGFDDLYGGSGKDTFVFKALSDFGTSKTATDTIFDFSHKESDRIGLSAIDASTKSSGNNAFSFIGSDGWHKKAGELRYDKAKSDTYVYGDVNGDGKADFVLHLDDAITLKAGDFIL